MTWPKSLTKKRFPDFEKQIKKQKARLDEEEAKEAQRKIDILTGKRMDLEPVDDDEEYWRYRAERFHNTGKPATPRGAREYAHDLVHALELRIDLLASEIRQMHQEINHLPLSEPVTPEAKEELKMAVQEIERRFKYYEPTDYDTIEKHQDLRAFALQFAYMVNSFCPEGREKALALTKIEEAVMWANAAIARGTAEQEENNEDNV